MDGTAQECQKATTEKGGGFFTPEPVFFLEVFCVFCFFFSSEISRVGDGLDSFPASFLVQQDGFWLFGKVPELSWLGSLSSFKKCRSQWNLDLDLSTNQNALFHVLPVSFLDMFDKVALLTADIIPKQSQHSRSEI